MTRPGASLVILGLLLTRTSQAGQAVASLGSPAAASLDSPFAFDGPPAPIAPEVISRDSSGRATVRAVRLTAPLRLDGALDDELYGSLRPISGFIQIEPQEGAPATEKTDVWLTYDDDHIYVSVRCWDSQPERLVATEMRRDNIAIFTGNDIVAFIFDTFYDRRNSVMFITNPIGGRSEGQVFNERQFSGDWNAIWEVKTGRFEGGWTLEAAIPFKSLRYRPGRAQIWGFNVLRVKRSKNEISFLTRMPPARGQVALQHASLAATVVGLEAPAGSRNLEIKPYVNSNLTTDLNATPKVSNDPGGDFGVDVKYGVTQNLTADFTYNTDFAQVEADEQQVNLTRFSVFFPEKREFFLENQGTFSFGGVATGGQMAGVGDTPILFYSRRIGLNQNRPVPLDVGGRLTGRIGRYSLGLLGIQAGAEDVSGSPRTAFSVVRLKRDLMRRSSIGLLFTGRSVRQNGTGSNSAYGADGTFSFFDGLNINTYWARTRSDGLSGKDTSYRAQLDYAGDRYGVQLERLVIGDNFNPEVGFLRRDDMRRTFGQLRFSPRPKANKSIRKYFVMGSMGYLENGAGRLETRDLDGELALEFQNSDRFSISYSRTYEFLPAPFKIASDISLPVGWYDYDSLRVAHTFGRQRRMGGMVALESGSFYSGHKTAISVTQGRLNVSARFSLEPTYAVNWVDLVEGSFTTHLLGSRVTYSMTPLMFTSALLQYNSSTHAVGANARLRWEYRPGSELFVVYTEERNTLARRFPDLANRAFVVKINRLFRF